ncbi:MAG: MFS transporter, partial [Chloroflexota bacterium]|nr:MFS transporter [Chloroflexota bacterium]
AQNVVNFSLLVLAQRLTNSSASVGLIILSFSLPAVLFSALAGVLVDRWDKRLVMVVSNVLRGAAVFSYIFVNSPNDMPYVYVASFMFASSAQFFAPAEGAVIPKLVGRDHLIAANSLYNLTFMASQFLGFTLIGWLLIRTLGLRNVFVVVFIVYLIGATVIGSIRLPTLRLQSRSQNFMREYWTELLEGWRFIVHRRVLLVTILHLSIANSIYLMLGTLGPAYVSAVLKIRAEDLGVLLAPAGVFTLLGVLTVGSRARPTNRQTMIHGGLAGVGISILGLAGIEPVSRGVSYVTGLSVPLSAVTLLAVLISMNFGFWAAFVTIPAQTVLQENSPDEIRGRVLSTFFTVSNAAAFFPILLAGAIADWIGILETMALVGGFILSVSVVSQYVYARAGHTWDRDRDPSVMVDA